MPEILTSPELCNSIILNGLSAFLVLSWIALLDNDGIKLSCFLYWQ